VISGAEVNAAPDVKVLNPVDDMVIQTEEATAMLAAVDCNQVFLGVGLQFSAGVSGEAVVSVNLNPDGTLDLFPIAGQVGTATVTLTAVDAFQHTAVASFTVSLVSDRIHVNANTPAAPAQQDGYSWNTAFGTLQDGLAAALTGQELWVAEGVYYPDEFGTTDTDDRFVYFDLPAGVSIYGGFGGFETDRSQRDFRARLTILSGDIRQDDSQQPIASHLLPLSGIGNNSCNVLDLTSATPGDTVDGLVVTAGFGDRSGWDVGAGIWVGEGIPTIANYLVTGNEVASNGAGLWIDKASSGIVKVSNCRFIGNKAGTSGGGVYVSKSYVDLHNCEIRGNEAPDGGGIYVTKYDVNLVNCVVSGNRGFFGGGGIHLYKGQFGLSNSTVTGNFTHGQGGGIRIAQADALFPPTVENSIIWNNRGGGSASSSSASIFVDNVLERPTVSNSLVANSGGSSAWDSSMGVDNGGNLDLDPSFVAGIDPNATPSGAGEFTLQANSSALDSGSSALLPADLLDLDGDGDTTEALPLDLNGQPRLSGGTVDMGAYEFGDPASLDSDGDGLPDLFEITHTGDPVLLDPLSDADGDGLCALGEFVHGLDPNAPLEAPVATYAPIDYLGTQYLTITFLVDPNALNFVTLTVERRGHLSNPLGWLEGQSLEISSVPSTTYPGLLEVTHRSMVPFGQESMEFLRVRHSTGP